MKVYILQYSERVVEIYHHKEQVEKIADDLNALITKMKNFRHNCQRVMDLYHPADFKRHFEGASGRVNLTTEDEKFLSKYTIVGIPERSYRVVEHELISNFS